MSHQERNIFLAPGVRLTVRDSMQFVAQTPNPTVTIPNGQLLSALAQVLAGTGLTGGGAFVDGDITLSVDATLIPFLAAASNTFTGLQVYDAHIDGGVTSPSIAAGTGAGTGAGTAPVVTVTGGDTAGLITVTTGTQVPAASAVIATVTFATTYGATPRYASADPANSATAALSGTARAWAQRVAGGATFDLRVGATPLAISTTYLWCYLVVL